MNKTILLPASILTSAVSLAMLAMAADPVQPAAKPKATTSARKLTATDQSNRATDMKVTQEIRKAAIGDSSLSLNAKNAKIITTESQVVLRGTVESEAERQRLEQYARASAGTRTLINDLAVRTPGK